MAAASDIPVGTGFNPNLINFKNFLSAIVDHSGDQSAMLSAVTAAPVRIKPYKSPPTKRSANLPLEAATQYGLLAPGYVASALAVRLDGLPETEAYEQFARHILLSLNGLRVVEAIQRMTADSLNVTGNSVAAYLSDQGLRVTLQNTAINSMRIWLSRASLFPSTRGQGAWVVDPIAKRRLVGLDDDAISRLTTLTPDQQAFLRALCRIGPVTDQPGATVRTNAEVAEGRRLDRANLPKTFLEPLEDLGYITFQAGGTRSGKTAVLTTTPQFEADILADFLDKAASSLDSTLMAYYQRASADIFKDLESSKVNVKGEALEAFAVMVMRQMGLHFVQWRKRARAETGQAEVDVLMKGVLGGLPTRWQVQCKNKPTGSVSLEDVAKEVGLLPLTKATHILVIANSSFTRDARTYAQEVMKHSHVTIFLLDKTDFGKLRDDPGSLSAVIREKAEESALLERTGLGWL